MSAPESSPIPDRLYYGPNGHTSRYPSEVVSTTEYIRADLCPKQELAGDMFVSTEPDGSRWVQHEDALKMEAEINALKAEVEKFKSLNNRHAKALNENDVEVDRANATVDVLMAELAALKAPPKVLSAEEVKETGAYWWKKIGADDFDEPVQVFEDEHYITHDPILIISRIGCVGAISQECWKGQFIGPIQMPGV